MIESVFDPVAVLRRWSAGDEPTPGEIKQLLAAELATENASAFGIIEANGKEKLEARSQLFRSVVDQVRQLCADFGFDNDDQVLLVLWQLWLPLAIGLAAARQELGRPLVQGILGGQGTGKTTLAAIIGSLLGHLGYSCLDLSIDDLYKTYEARQQLRRQDPRLIWRGPPGTHDVELGVQLLDKVRQPHRQEQILVPRFDKSARGGIGDRLEPESVEQPDILLFEGWLVGVRPVEATVFDNPPSPINTPEDRQFALDCNQRLKDYLPLWERLDSLIVLYPVDYRLGKQWRREAEQKMIATGKPGMTDGEIEQFVEYFWTALHPDLFIAPLIDKPDIVDLVIEIKSDRRISRIYRPSDRT